MMYDEHSLHLSMDQLHESPSDHRSLFLHWFVWLKYLVRFVGQVESCIDTNVLNYICFGNMAVAVLVLGTVGMMAYCRKKLFLIDLA